MIGLPMKLATAIRLQKPFTGFPTHSPAGKRESDPAGNGATIHSGNKSSGGSHRNRSESIPEGIFAMTGRFFPTIRLPATLPPIDDLDQPHSFALAGSWSTSQSLKCVIWTDPHLSWNLVSMGW
jgi:hypothetical protein